jgi:hypothetical protein
VLRRPIESALLSAGLLAFPLFIAEQTKSFCLRSASLKPFAIGLARRRIVLMMGPFPVSGLDDIGPSCETVERRPAVPWSIFDPFACGMAAWRRGEGTM